ncbi:MAG: hypothetical protein H0V37_13915 [Chloroflexia bacterium]|nr:hypothetical protein [Chloroflexia bacterium]
MASTAIRVEAQTHATLREWSEEQDKTIGQIVAELVEGQRRARFWRQVRDDYARLQADPAAWQAYRDEVTFFEGGSMDGLEHEEPYYTPEEEEEIRAYARSQGW